MLTSTMSAAAPAAVSPTETVAVTVPTKTLMASLARVIRARSNIMSVEVADTSMRLRGRGELLSVTDTVPAEVTGSGQINVPVKLFHDTVRRLPGDEVTLSFSDGEGGVAVQSGPVQLRVNSFLTNDSPIPDTVSGSEATIDAARFIGAVNRVVGAASNDPDRHVLQAVLFEPAAATLRMTATDSYRLATVEMDTDALASATGTALVPGRSLAEVAALFRDDPVLTICVGDRVVRFSNGDTQLDTTLFQGNFPAYQAVIPTDVAYVAEFKVADLVAAAERTRPFLGARPMEICFGESDDTARVYGWSAETGTITEQVPVTYQAWPEGSDPIVVGFNPVYVLHALKCFTSDTIQMGFNDAARPVLLRDERDGSYQHVVMPVRIS